MISMVFAIEIVKGSQLCGIQHKLVSNTQKLGCREVKKNFKIIYHKLVQYFSHQHGQNTLSNTLFADRLQPYTVLWLRETTYETFVATIRCRTKPLE